MIDLEKEKTCLSNKIFSTPDLGRLDIVQVRLENNTTLKGHGGYQFICSENRNQVEGEFKSRSSSDMKKHSTIGRQSPCCFYTTICCGKEGFVNCHSGK